MFDIEKELRQIKFDTAHPSERLRQKTQQLVAQEVRKKQQTKPLGRLKWVLTSAMAVFAAFMIMFSLPPAADGISYYTVDINPSISVKVNTSRTVLEVSAENDDAVLLLKHVKLEGLALNEALSEFIKAADDQGYLKDQGHVLVAHFGEAASLTQQEIEDVVSGATEREVTALLLQSTKYEFEQTKAQHGQPGIELLKKKAAEQGIKERNVDEIIEQIRGNSAKQQNDKHNTPKQSEKADNRPTATAIENDQSEKDNSGGAGNSKNAKDYEQGYSNNESSNKDDKEVKENDGNVSGKIEDKPVSGGNGNQNNNNENNNNENNNGNENSSDSQKNGDENKNEHADNSNASQQDKSDNQQENDEQNEKADR